MNFLQNASEPIAEYMRVFSSNARPFLNTSSNTLFRKQKSGWLWVAAGSAVTLLGVAAGVALRKGWGRKAQAPLADNLSDAKTTVSNAASQTQAVAEDAVDAATDAVPDETPEFSVNVGGDGMAVARNGNPIAVDLSEMNKKELYTLAQEKDIQGRSLMNKDALVEALENVF